MTQNRKLFGKIVFSWIMLLTGGLFAHDGHHDTTASHATPALRQWHFMDGSVESGSYVASNSQRVQIRLADTRLMEVSIDQLMPLDRDWVKIKKQQIDHLNSAQAVRLVAQPPQQASRNVPRPTIADHFKPFEKTLQLRWDQDFLYVGSNGMPDHQMMVGIRAWQQQVPIPQKYFGDNAWRIPLHPVPAKEPAMTKNRFLRGAIALAVNGIPIFNPLNNRGDDAYLFGELDEYGGHCGRADDYHYHLAPVHLEKLIGKGNPIAYALDGYPILGYQTPEDPDFAPLDRLNGHKDKQGNYHYHATTKYPYLNGGFYGVVVEKDGQVDPQPRAEPMRPALPPMQGARITGFKETRPGSFELIYSVGSKNGYVRYTLKDAGAVFEFTDVDGRKKTETYQARPRGPGGRPDRENPRPESPDRNPPRPNSFAVNPRQNSRTASKDERSIASLEVTSESIDRNGFLLVDCTCDGKSQSPSVKWRGAPTGTRTFAISLWHTAPDQEKSYWVLYNIPGTQSAIGQNSRNIGTAGLNDKRRNEYDPMCSKGPGVKTYHITVYALSDKIDLAPNQVTRTALLEAIKGITLAEGTFDYQYERKGK